MDALEYDDAEEYVLVIGCYFSVGSCVSAVLRAMETGPARTSKTEEQ